MSRQNGPQPQALMERFMACVEFELNTGCWLWSGTANQDGYGRLRVDQRGRMAHRISWALHAGREPPADLMVCHRCDTPACVNPDHLFIGTAKDNADDMMTKGRHARMGPRGEGHPHARLTETQVREILNVPRYRPIAPLAEKFGVCMDTLHKIRGGRIWKHLQRLPAVPNLGSEG